MLPVCQFGWLASSFAEEKGQTNNDDGGDDEHGYYYNEYDLGLFCKVTCVTLHLTWAINIKLFALGWSCKVGIFHLQLLPPMYPILSGEAIV